MPLGEPLNMQGVGNRFTIEKKVPIATIAIFLGEQPS